MCIYIYFMMFHVKEIVLTKYQHIYNLNVLLFYAWTNRLKCGLSLATCFIWCWIFTKQLFILVLDESSGLFNSFKTELCKSGGV